MNTGTGFGWVAAGLVWGCLSGTALAGKGDPEWTTQAFVRPAAGMSSWTSGDTTVAAVTLGARAGMNYWQSGGRQLPRWQGQARVAGDYLMSAGDVSGWEVRVGNFVGPTWKHVGLSIGPDLFHNRYTIAGVELAPVTGIATPVIVSGMVDNFSVYGGIEPSWYIVGEREGADWQDPENPFGFGDEFRYLAGANVQVGDFSVGVNYQYRITSGGNESGFGVSGRYSPPPKTRGSKGKKGKKGR